MFVGIYIYRGISLPGFLSFLGGSKWISSICSVIHPDSSDALSVRRYGHGAGMFFTHTPIGSLWVGNALQPWLKPSYTTAMRLQVLKL